MIVIMVNSVSFLPHQGRYRRTLNEARTLVEAGHDVTLLAWDRDCKSPEHEIVEGVKVERLRSRAGLSHRGPARNLMRVVAFYLRLFWCLLRREMDVIHCFNLDVIPPAFLVGKLRGKKLVMDLAEPYYYTYWPPRYAAAVRLIARMERWFAEHFDLVLVHNLFQVRKFRGYGVPHVLRVSSVPGRELIRDDLPGRAKAAAESAEVVLGRIGTIYKQNMMEELAQAFGRIVAERPNVKLLLAGAVHPDYRQVFESLFQPFGDRVEVTGAFDTARLPELYSKVDVSIQLTPRPGFYRHVTPTKFFDSLACGVPVITSDIGDIRELTRRWPSAEIVDEADPESIHHGMLRLIDDPELRKQMAEAGLALVHEDWNWERMSARLVRAYRDFETSGPGGCRGRAEAA